MITLDYRLPDMSGIEVLRRIKQENSDIQVIPISEQNDIEVVVDLLKEGAYDYIVKTNINVSISGETGTGKELVAKAIHYNSSRKAKPFVTVNVSAIPADLVESELFGHEKGAFTGASFQRKGKFEEANGGTLFLDEIAEMDISFQAKLLRALQEKEITRVGSNQVIKVNCRIITATNKNLLQEVKKGNFRQDLYYRLIGLPIELPPLRERDRDVLILAKFFMTSFCEENNLPVRKISADARKKLFGYTFPGNIRELNNKLRKSGSTIAALNEKVKSLEETLAMRDSTLNLLKADLVEREFKLAELNVVVDSLNEDIETYNKDLQAYEQMVDAQYAELNKAYVATGSVKELEEKGLITREGGFLGLGKSKSLKPDLSEEPFEKLVITETRKIMLNAKKAELISEHPTTSYELVENDTIISYLEIKDPEAFWKITRYAVVETKNKKKGRQQVRKHALRKGHGN